MSASASQSRPHIVRRFVQWTIFPVVFALAIGGTLFALQFGWEIQTAVTAAMVISAVVIAVAEYFQPHAQEWLEDHDDIPTDVAHLLFSTIAIPLIFHVALHAMLMVVAVSLATASGFSLWPTSLPTLIQLALALVVGEFAQYWWHRLAHEKPLLWRFHAAHHSSPRLYWLNSCRFHPVDAFAQYTLEVTPLILLGCGETVLALFTLCTAVIGMFQHANVELRVGPLNWIFSMTELHRWHHSREHVGGHSNYGANLIVWDIVFGTRYLPADRQHQSDDVGLAGMPYFPQRYWGQLTAPFRWQSWRRPAIRHERALNDQRLVDTGQEPVH